MPLPSPQVPLPTPAPMKVDFDTATLQTKLIALESQLPSYRQQLVQRRYHLSLLLASLYADVLQSDLDEQLRALERRLLEAKMETQSAQ
ncbi:hypothetical protein EON64_10140 [archaeon]|nr:MAG: hypothetical protein EON64_10140 [archaeon]